MHDAEPQPALYTAAEVRALDRAAIDGAGIPGIVLMSRAGRAVFDLIAARFAAGAPLSVVCGTGNNGGDGFVVARRAADSQETVVSARKPSPGPLASVSSSSSRFP